MAGPTSTHSASASATPSKLAETGIIQGANPSKYNANDPIVLFIIQAGIILILCRLLHWPLSKIRQPRVIAEVIGGIILGPTVMGRIPGFTAAIFPTASMPILNLTANLGLVLFLFLVGLEVDMRVLLGNWKAAAGVGAAGMIIPFGLGCGIATGLYHQFRVTEGVGDINFGVYLLFIGVAMAITAFPVLARILTELKLLPTRVGTIVLSAGVANDVVGWILLALTVALVNAGSGITALYVLLVAVGYVLFLVYAVQPVYVWTLRRNGSLEHGPSQSMVALTLLLVLFSAFFTDIIGIHPIFGGFLVGLIIPHDAGFAVKLTEKIEDLVTVLFLPLYFALSGLKTNIALLDNGITWAYVVGVIVVAFVGKIAGGTLAAKACGMVWRESFTIGVLMSCKGLVELIVLNIGLQAGILSTRVFTIFVVMALITTFATTPLVIWLYPDWYQVKIEAWRRGEIDWDTGNRSMPEDGSSAADTISREKLRTTRITKATMLLRLDNLASMFSFAGLLEGQQPPRAPKVHKSKRRTSALPEDHRTGHMRPVELHGIRLEELTQRTSAVMQVTEMDGMQERDPTLNVFRTWGMMHNLAVSVELSIAPEEEYANVLTSRAEHQRADLLVVPWSETGAIGDVPDALINTENRFISQQHNSFISRVLATASCSTAILVNRGFGVQAEKMLHRTISQRSMHSHKSLGAIHPVGPITDPSHHIFFPFVGGCDDRMALRFVLQLAENVNVTATIVRVIYSANAAPDPGLELPSPAATRQDLPRQLSLSNFPAMASASDPTRRSSHHEADEAFFSTMADSLPRELQDRVVFETTMTAQPLEYMLAKALTEVGSTKNGGDLVVLGRSVEEYRPHIREALPGILQSLDTPGGAGAETRKCLGDVAEVFIVANTTASVLVLQAGGSALDRAHVEDNNVFVSRSLEDPK